MSEIELINKVIDWFIKMNIEIKGRPHRYKPKEVADAVGGAYGSVGKIADSVVSELVKRRVKIRYSREIKNKPFFELF